MTESYKASHLRLSTQFLIHIAILGTVLFLGLARTHANTPTRIFWTDCLTGNVLSSDLSGGDIQTVASGQGCVTGIDVDLDGGKVYWVTAGGSGFRSDLDGNNPQQIISSPGSTLADVEIDHENGTFYWTDTTSQKLFRANLSDANPTGQEVGTDLNASAIALDPINSYIYFTRPNSGIYRVDYDGTNEVPINEVNGRSYDSLTLDLFNNDLYFKGGNDIRRYDLDSDSDTLFSTISGNSYGIEVDAANNAAYFTLAGSKTVNKQALDSNSPTVLYTESSGSSIIYDISLGIPSAAPSDATPPNITCPVNVTVSNDIDTAGALLTFPEATATDGGGTATVSYTIGGNPVERVERFFEIGTTTITAIATDEADNTSDCTFDIIVNDTQNPTITCPVEDIVTEIRSADNSAIVSYEVTFDDNAPGAALNRTQGLASGAAFPRGTTLVAFTVTDASGNMASCQFNVIVQTDATLPQITLSGDDPFTLEGGTPFVNVDPGATATDNVDGDLSPDIMVTGDVDELVLGNYTVTYTVTDSSGNEAATSRTVTVVDTTQPEVTLVGENPFVLEATTTFNDPGVTISDIIDPNPLLNTSSDLDAAVPGDYTITYTVTDSANNETILTRNITVVDTTPPVIALEGANPQSVLVNDNYVEQGATVQDSVDGDISNAIVVDASAVNTSTVGSYIVTYNVSDNAANAATQVTRTVNVVAQLEPTITLIGANPQIIPVGTGYVELGATAQDNVGVDVSNDIVINASAVDTNAVGTYNVTYTVTDDENHTQSVIRTVNVVDQLPPTITLLGDNPQQVLLGTPYTELGATAQDNVDGDISENIVINAGSVNVNVVGTYTVTYNVSDTVGNAATEVTRTVEVFEPVNPAPEIITTSPQNGATDVAVNANITLQLDEAVTRTGDGQVTFVCQPNDVAIVLSVVGNTGDSYTLAPIGGLPMDSTCTLTIPTDLVSDSDNNPLADDDGVADETYTLSFSTPVVPPRITNIETQTIPNTATVRINSTIQITVSETPLTIGAPVPLVCNGVPQPFVAGQGATPNIFVLTPNTNLPFDATCTLSITIATVQDPSGNELIDSDNNPNDDVYNFTFDTEAAPRIVSTTPTENQGAVPLDSNITLETNEPLRGSGMGRVSLVCGGQVIPLKITSLNALTYVFAPTTNLPVGTTCVLSITTDAAVDSDNNFLTDTNGNNDGTFVLNFTTTSEANAAAVESAGQPQSPIVIESAVSTE